MSSFPQHGESDGDDPSYGKKLAALYLRIKDRSLQLAWQPIDTAPRDGTECLYYTPGKPDASIKAARRSRMVVDKFSAEWPKAMHQYPEAPYTHWMTLPPKPDGGAL